MLEYMVCYLFAVFFRFVVLGCVMYGAAVLYIQVVELQCAHVHCTAVHIILRLQSLLFRVLQCILSQFQITVWTNISHFESFRFHMELYCSSLTHPNVGNRQTYRIKYAFNYCTLIIICDGKQPILHIFGCSTSTLYPTYYTYAPVSLPIYTIKG